MTIGSFDSARRTPWFAVTVGGISLYLALSFLFLLWGQPNADEGWYLYAAKLVLNGKVRKSHIHLLFGSQPDHLYLDSPKVCRRDSGWHCIYAICGVCLRDIL